MKKAPQIFQGRESQPIKFFLQKDLPEDVQTELIQLIETYGGQTTSKVPRIGYLLIDAHTEEGRRLIEVWNEPTRPYRAFVPYTWVDACRAAGRELKQIFRLEGQPMKLHIHPNVRNENVRMTLHQRIKHSGGDPNSLEVDADVILADPDSQEWDGLLRDYKGGHSKYIESFTWVKQCIDDERVEYTERKDPNTRRSGHQRMAFTRADDEHLCQWIAEHIPHKTASGRQGNQIGRTGNKTYQQLMEMEHEDGYEWVTRHTWQSWRERYKNNAERLDRRIAEYVAESQLTLDRPATRRTHDRDDSSFLPPRKKAKTVQKRDVSENFDSDLFDISGTTLSPTPEVSMRALTGASPPSTPLAKPIVHSIASAQACLHSPTLSTPLRDLSLPADETQTWPIRVGNDPPPRWGKRKASEIEDIENETGIEAEQREINEIAVATRFTVDEVREHYTRVGDLGRTRERFEAMRMHLTLNFE